jgi:hypothetical protein
MKSDLGKQAGRLVDHRLDVRRLRQQDGVAAFL